MSASQLKIVSQCDEFSQTEYTEGCVIDQPLAMTEQEASPVRIDGKPPGVHEHGERRPVSDVMTEEVIHEKIEGGFPRPVVEASIDHGANAGRNFLIVVINHRHLPQAFV